MDRLQTGSSVFEHQNISSKAFAAIKIKQ